MPELQCAAQKRSPSQSARTCDELVRSDRTEGHAFYVLDGYDRFVQCRLQM